MPLLAVIARAQLCSGQYTHKQRVQSWTIQGMACMSCGSVHLGPSQEPTRPTKWMSTDREGPMRPGDSLEVALKLVRKEVEAV
jgi:hypothetical protein